MQLAGLQKGGSQRRALGLAAIWQEGRELARLRPLGTAWHQFCQALRSIAVSPLTSILTVVTIAVAMCLLASFILFLENAGSYLQTTRRRLGVSLYLRDDASEAVVQSLRSEVEKLPQVESVSYRSKGEALKDFQQVLGEQVGLLEGLEGANPLPASLEVRLRDGSEEAFRSLAQRFKGHAAVEQVQYDQGVVGQLGGMVETLKAVGLVAAILVLLMTAFIIASTIKLALYSHREEIEIMRLVGATDPFVRAPYVIEGCLQGALGSLSSLLVVYALFLIFRNFVQSSPVFALAMPNLIFLSWSSQLLVCFLGVAVGIGGSYIALKRFYSN